MCWRISFLSLGGKVSLLVTACKLPPIESTDRVHTNHLLTVPVVEEKMVTKELKVEVPVETKSQEIKEVVVTKVIFDGKSVVKSILIFSIVLDFVGMYAQM